MPARRANLLKRLIKTLMQEECMKKCAQRNIKEAIKRQKRLLKINRAVPAWRSSAGQCWGCQKCLVFEHKSDSIEAYLN